LKGLDRSNESLRDMTSHFFVFCFSDFFRQNLDLIRFDSIDPIIAMSPKASQKLVPNISRRVCDFVCSLGYKGTKTRQEKGSGEEYTKEKKKKKKKKETKNMPNSEASDGRNTQSI
jgi:hypothetical protein